MASRYSVPIIYKGQCNFIVEAADPQEARAIARDRYRHGDLFDLTGGEWEEIDRMGEPQPTSEPVRPGPPGPRKLKAKPLFALINGCGAAEPGTGGAAVFSTLPMALSAACKIIYALNTGEGNPDHATLMLRVIEGGDYEAAYSMWREIEAHDFQIEAAHVVILPLNLDDDGGLENPPTLKLDHSISKLLGGPIQAEAHAVDRPAGKIAFDVTRWFIQAQPQEVAALRDCDWGAGSPAYDLMDYMREYEPGLHEMICRHESEACGTNPNDPVNFECRVNAEQAIMWLRKHRPNVAQTIDHQDHNDSGSKEWRRSGLF